MSKYKIAEVAVEIKDNGEIIYWVYCAGTFPEQGGMAFTYGNFGTPNLEQSLDKMKRIILKDRDFILEKVKGRENAPNGGVNENN
jgi:hypothetical protein